MKKVTLFLIAIFCLGLAGCSRDAEVNAFITEFDAATQDIVAKIDADPSAAGIDAAQKSFGTKRLSLKAKFDAIKGAVGMQVSEATMKKLKESVDKNTKALTDVSTKNMTKIAMDKDASAKFRTLMADFQSTIAK